MKGVKHVLIVDDSHDDLLLFQRILTKIAPHSTIFTAQNGEAALNYLRLANAGAMTFPKPDLLLLDIKMPRVDGFEVLDAIRKDPVLRVIPTFVLSSSSFPHDAQRAHDLGADGFITKSSSLDDTEALFRALLHDWRSVAQQTWTDSMDECGLGHSPDVL